MKVDREMDASRWRALEAELARARADLASATVLLDEAGAESDGSAASTTKSALQARNATLAATNRRLRAAIKAEHAASANLKSLVESTNTATIVLDSGLNVRLATPASAEFFNIRAADIGRPLAELAPLVPDPKLIADAQTVMFSGVAVDHEIEAPDGRCLLRDIQPSHAEGAKIDGVIITYCDITANKRKNDALTTERDEADTASQAKSQYLAAANHDLRQPLQAMATLQALLAQSAKDSGSQALIARLDSSLQAISSLLDTLLDDDRIENGTASFDSHPVPLETLFAALAEAHGLTAEADGTTLHFSPSHAIVCSDPMLLQQMLSNLIGNALRFAPEGKVLVGARPRGKNIRIEIWDNGIGIDPARAEEIFEPYKQIQPDSGRGGQGLGLSIVKSLGQLLGHAVAVHSVPGSGSVFSVEVPLANTPAIEAPEPERAKSDSRPKGSGLVVHIIDDDAAVLQSLGELMTAAGHSVQCHGSAMDFRKNWQPARAGCLLVDAKLPTEDGLTLLRSLKEKGQMPPSIIITGRGDVATAAAAMRLGTIDFLEKPLPPQDLLAAVDRAFAIHETMRADTRDRDAARKSLSTLTKRERQILGLVLDGHPSKNISADLGVSQRTVENHRAAMMRKTGSRSLAALVRLAVAAEQEPEPDSEI